MPNLLPSVLGYLVNRVVIGRVLLQRHRDIGELFRFAGFEVQIIVSLESRRIGTDLAAAAAEVRTLFKPGVREQVVLGFGDVRIIVIGGRVMIIDKIRPGLISRGVRRLVGLQNLDIVDVILGIVHRLENQIKRGVISAVYNERIFLPGVGVLQDALRDDRFKIKGGIL